MISNGSKRHQMKRKFLFFFIKEKNSIEIFRNQWAQFKLWNLLGCGLDRCDVDIEPGQIPRLHESFTYCHVC